MNLAVAPSAPRPVAAPPVAAAPGRPPAAPTPPTAPAVTTPAGGLVVPDEFRQQLDVAIEAGRTDAQAFASTHAPEERQLVRDWALLKLPHPPADDAPELAWMHQVAAARTPEGNAAAQRWASDGTRTAAEARLAEYEAVAGPEDARAARKLLEDATMIVNTTTQISKSSELRKRPFVSDPTLPIVVTRPGNNPSYPSGHTSVAFAAASVLAHLMPDRAEEFMGVAAEAGWSRVYGGVHFPSDVVAGARLASTITSHLAATSGARPVLGTAQAGPAPAPAPAPVPAPAG